MSSLQEAVAEMLRLYGTWPVQLERSFSAASSLRHEPVSPEAIVICGMGGSGVTGDYLAALASARGLRTPVFVHKSDGVPNWVSRDHLVLAVSYSGNTYETLSCARQARAAGALVASVTSGGKLGEWARSNGLPLALIDQGFYPRTALSMLVGASLGLLASLGVKLVDEADVRSAVSALSATSVGEGEAIARAIWDRDVYVVAGCGPFEIVAHRWRQELSENSKVIAKTEFYPESAHNDLVAWQQRSPVRKAFILIEGGGRLCDVITKLLAQVYSSQGDALVRVSPRGDGLLAQLLQASLLAGYASVYLAALRGVDPRVTDITARYKRAIDEAGLD